MTTAITGFLLASGLAGLRPLVRSVRALIRSREQALTDPLTGLGNRRRLMEDLEDELLAATEIEPRVLVLLDLDGFKGYNDAYGHPAGDVLLARLGRELGQAVRPWGAAYRLGGDEFCVLVSDRSPGLEPVVSAAAAALSDHGEGFAVRPSCGMAAIPSEVETPDAALQLADRRLYAQKASRHERTSSDEAREVLLQILREREPALGAHLSGVAELARVVGRALGLVGAELDVIVRAAELHDVGKVAVPDAILRKPGPLDEAEWAYVRQHTLVADRILSAASAMAPVARLVRASHERWDGSGYPDGLSGTDIPLGARIVAVCDAYDSMVSGRPYRGPIEPEAALEELRREAGVQFDPDVVHAFCQAVTASCGRRDRRTRRARGRALLVSAAVGLVTMVVPAAALGAQASVHTGLGQLSVTAGTAEENDLTIALDGTSLRVTEAGAGVPLTAGNGCVVDVPGQLLCAAGAVTSIVVNAGDGDDQVRVTAPVRATLNGGSSDDSLYGGPLADTLSGDDGHDRLDGGLGADTLNGGSGLDWVSYADRTAPVAVDIDGVADDGELLEGDNVNVDVESVAGGHGDDVLTGNAGLNGFDGGPGADTMNGGGGSDWVVYWTRTAPVTVDLETVGGDGEAGENDTIVDIYNVIGGAGDDTLSGDGNANYLVGMGGDDVLRGRGGADGFSGGDGRDRVTYSERTNPVVVTIDDVANDGEVGEGDSVQTNVEDVTGGAGDDTITGSPAANRIEGGGGEDVVHGGAGDDEFQMRDQAADSVTCGDGADSVTGDTADSAAADCEFVDLADPPVDPDPDPDPDADPEPDADSGEDSDNPGSEPGGAMATVATSIRAVTMDADGIVAIPVSCAETPQVICRGSITLRMLPPKAKAKAKASADAAARPAKRRRKRGRFLGQVGFEVEPGGTVAVKIQISRNGRRRVLRRRKVRCSMNVTVLAGDGTRVKSTSRLTLKSPKPRRRSR